MLFRSCDVDLKARRKKRKHIKNKRKKWRRDILKQNDYDDCDIAEDDGPDVDILGRYDIGFFGYLL